MVNSIEKIGYRADNDDALPEGNSFAQINTLLNRPNCGSTKQVVRACVDDSGTKVSSNSDETDVTNNYEGFILQGEPSGSLELTLQGRNNHSTNVTQELRVYLANLKANNTIDTATIANSNNEQFLEENREESTRGL